MKKTREKIQIITFFLFFLVIFVVPTNKIDAGEYQCNPHNCNCRTETYDCNQKVEKCTYGCIGGYAIVCFEYVNVNYPTQCKPSCLEWGYDCVKVDQWVINGCSNYVCDTCYDTCCEELNISPSQPTSVILNSNGEDNILSLNENDPTTLTLENPTLTLPELTPPATSDGVGYQYRFYNQSGTLIDTIEDTNRTQNIPTSVVETMNTGGTFKISGLYYTVNECDTDKKYSTPLETYITTNNLPKPICTGTCTLENIFSGLGSDSIYGCSNSSYTGIKMNNPLNIDVTLADEDGISEIEGMILWFRDTSSTTIQNFGVKILKNSDWDNLQTQYTNNGTNWISTSEELIPNSEGDNIARIYNISATSDTTVNIQFGLELLQAQTPLQGNYEVYIQGIDTPTITNENLDPSRMQYISEIGIDLIEPAMEDEITTDLTDIQNILFSWNSTDNESGILTTRINGYVSVDNQAFQPSPIFLNSTEITNIEAPEREDADLIGLLDDPYGISINPPTEQVGLNIGNNEYGDISIYVRTFDNACNSVIRTDSVSFSPWVSTQGGHFFSQLGTRVDSKDVSNLTELNEELYNFDVSTISQGTEVLASKSQYIYDLIHPELQSVSATSIDDVNNRALYWYSQILNLSDNTTNLETPNDECTEEFCFYKSEESITLNPDFECNSKTVFISEQNINISPQQKEPSGITTDNDNACIFVAKNNIYITNTGHESTTKDISYDFLEGFFIADNQIIINRGSTEEDQKYGLEIEGGLVAFGDTEPRSIQNNRSLGAYNLIAPSLLVNYHPKYSKISEDLVGTISTTYIKETGLNRK